MVVGVAIMVSNPKLIKKYSESQGGLVSRLISKDNLACSTGLQAMIAVTSILPKKSLDPPSTVSGQL